MCVGQPGVEREGRHLDRKADEQQDEGDQLHVLVELARLGDFRQLDQAEDAFAIEDLAAVEVEELVNEAISSTGAEKMADMGKVMGQLKSKLQGRADMTQVSALIKAKLS